MSKKEEALDMDTLRESLKRNERFFYDLQRLRIQAGNRNNEHTDPVILGQKDKEFLKRMSEGVKELEKDTLKEIRRLLKHFPIYTKFLKDVKGVGPTLAAVMISEVDITKANTISALWAWCGLGVDEHGKAMRLKKGEKARYSPFLKAKMVKVLGDCLLKSQGPYTKFYYNYKTRKENTIVEVCMNCKGKGIFRSKELKKDLKCSNCKGTGHDAPWGCSQAHRHTAAIRAMVKALLQDFWLKWRELEGLPVTAPYAEAKLGMKHGDHATIPIRARP